MASNDVLAELLPQGAVLPATGFAQFDTITAATGDRLVLDFAAETNEAAIWSFAMPPNYAGGGVTLRLYGAMDSTNTGLKGVRVEAAFERVALGDGLGAGGSDFASAQVATLSVNNTANALFDGVIGFTNGAQMDSVAAGDGFRIIIRRLATDGADDAVGDWQFTGARLTEA